MTNAIDWDSKLKKIDDDKFKEIEEYVSYKRDGYTVDEKNEFTRLWKIYNDNLIEKNYIDELIEINKNAINFGQQVKMNTQLFSTFHKMKNNQFKLK